MIKLLPCDVKITDSSHGNNLLLYIIKLCTIDPSSEPYIDRNFIYQTALFIICCLIEVIINA